MARPFLFTSLPPAMNRFDARGLNIGRDYQLACIRSWIACGFEVVSVNARSERLPAYLTDLVRVERVERDASAQTGKALPYISDILAIIERVCGGGSFIFVNADILMRPGSVQVCDVVNGLTSGRCVLERRYDIESMDAMESACPYMGGFDAFAFTIEDAKRLALDGFVIGMPWWDIAVVMGALFSGCQRINLGHPVAYHLIHEERWDKKFALPFGELFLERIVRREMDSPLWRAYRQDYEAALTLPPVYAGLKKRTLVHVLERIGIGRSRGILRRLGPSTKELLKHL